MKREMMAALIGVSFLVPSDADAQRGRRGGHVAAPAPVTVSGRLANCRRPADARPFDCRARVVYRSGPRYVSPRAGYSWVRVDWRPIRYAPVRYARVDRYDRFDRYLDHGDLRHLLGRRTVDMLRDEGRRMGLRGALRGEWLDVRRQGRVLIVRMEGVDIAELVDIDWNGTIDDVFLLRHNRFGRTLAMR